MNWLYLAILLIPITAFLTVKLLSRRVKISYSISPLSWIWVDFTIYYVTLILTLECTLKSLSLNEYESNNFDVLFTQQGGLIIFVMVSTNILYKCMVNSFDLDLTKNYSTIYAKVLFTSVCMTCAYLCYYIGKQYPENSYLLYSQAMMWLVVTVQIWIGFGSLIKSRLEKKSLRDITNYVKHSYKDILKCLLPTFIGPISLIIFYKFISMIDYKMPVWIHSLFKIVLFEIFVFMCSVFILLFHRNPFKKYDIYRTKKKIKLLKNKERVTGYYQNIKYSISHQNEKYEIYVYGLNILLDNNNKLPKKDKNKLLGLGDPQRRTFDMEPDKMLKYLDDIDKARTTTLRNAYTKIKERYLENEMEVL